MSALDWRNLCIPISSVIRPSACSTCVHIKQLLLLAAQLIVHCSSCFLPMNRKHL